MERIGHYGMHVVSYLNNIKVKQPKSLLSGKKFGGGLINQETLTNYYINMGFNNGFLIMLRLKSY